MITHKEGCPGNPLCMCLLSVRCKHLCECFAPILAIFNLKHVYAHLAGGCYVALAVVYEECLIGLHIAFEKHFAVYLLARLGAVHLVAEEKHIEIVIERLALGCELLAACPALYKGVGVAQYREAVAGAQLLQEFEELGLYLHDEAHPGVLGFGIAYGAVTYLCELCAELLGGDVAVLQ